MTERKERESDLTPIEIRFGMVYEYVFENKSRQYVIVELGDDNYCFGAPVTLEGGQESLRSSGTTTLSDIHQITGDVWPLKRVLDAFQNGFKLIGGAPEEIIEILKKESLKPPRILTR